MSVVTSILIVCPITGGSEEDKFIQLCETRVRRIQLAGGTLPLGEPWLKRLNDASGGNKAPQMEMWGTSINCFDWENFLKFFLRLEVDNPMAYTCIMHYEHWDVPHTFNPGDPVEFSDVERLRGFP